MGSRKTADKPASRPKAARPARKAPRPRKRARKHVRATRAAKEALLPSDVRAESRKLAGLTPNQRRQARQEGTRLIDQKGVQLGGPAGQALAQQVAEDAQRKLRAFQLKVSGASYADIAKQIGCSYQTAFRDVHETLREYHAQLQEMAHEARSLAIAETYQVSLAMAVAMGKGDAHAATVFLKSIELRARLQGTFAPVKIAPTDPGGMRPYAGQTLEALRTGLLAEIQQLLGVQVVQASQAGGDAPVPVQALAAASIPTYDPVADGPDDPADTIDVQPVMDRPQTWVQEAASNGHHPPKEATDGDKERPRDVQERRPDPHEPGVGGDGPEDA
jgi:hypothetical protein